MNDRANSSSGPKADGSDPVAYAILAGVAVGLLLLVVGYLLDPHDTYFNALLPVSLAGGAIVAYSVWRRERQTSFFQPHGPFESDCGHGDANSLRRARVTWFTQSQPCSRKDATRREIP